MKVNLAARPADAVGALARRAGGPKVFVLVAALDAVVRQTDVLGPNAGCLVVVFVDGDRQPRRIDAQPLLVGEKLPGPVDRIALEIVAERKIAEHLEKRVVVRGPADVFDVAGPQALLAARGAGELQFHLAQKVVLELVHPRRREQHAGIPRRHQHVAGDAAMALRFKEGEILFAEFVGVHEEQGRGRRSGKD